MAVRIRDALDPLLIEDALEHCSRAGLAQMRADIRCMATAVEAQDPVAFVRSNWQLHASIARISPNELLRSVYLSLLDVVEVHTASVQPSWRCPWTSTSVRAWTCTGISWKRSVGRAHPRPDGSSRSTPWRVNRRGSWGEGLVFATRSSPVRVFRVAPIAQW